MVLHFIRNRFSLAEVGHLIETGRDVNAYDKSGWTPLLKAAYHGHAEVARELIRANADVHLKIKESRSGRTVLHSAAYYICKVWLMFISVLMKFILATTTGVDEQAAVRGAEEDMHWKVRGSGRTALHVAAYYGHQALVKLFLETNISLNEQDDEGRTALMLAVQRGHSGVVAELVKAGADVSIKDKKGMTAVLMAKGHDMVHQLVGDADSLSRVDCGRILWHACDVGDLSMVRSVIEAGCDVDHIHKGQTPLMMATLRGHNQIVKELILANCDVNCRSDVMFRDKVNTMTKVIWANEYHWTAVMLCGLLPWMEFQMDVEAALWTDPVWGCLVLLVMSLLAILGGWLLPGSRTIMLLRTGMVAIARIMAIKVAMVAGPVAWTASLMAIVALPLVMRARESSMAEVTKGVVGIVVAVTFCTCTALALLFVVPAILVWSPRDITGTEIVVGVLIMVVAGILRKVLLRRMVQVRWDVVMALLEGVIRNVELFVIASSCMMMARKVFVLHESQATQGMVELLTAVVFIIWFLLMVLKTQATEMTLFRGAAGIFVFEAIKLLKMENALVSLDKPHLVLVLVVLLLAAIVINLINCLAKTVNLLKVLVVLLHLVVAVMEAYLALVISKPEGAEMWIRTVNLGEFVNLAVVLAMLFSDKARNFTALHYAARYNHIKCGLLLAEAGADVLARSLYLINLFDIGSKSFVDGVKEVLTLTTKRVIAVIGNSECGKSTLVAALERNSNILWKKAINRFRKVHDIRQRTAGIEAVPLSSQKYGEALFYDFAGQSQYHGPHHSFLEAMVSKPDVSVTLLLLVKATEEENIITQQLHRWLQPLAQRPTPFPPQVIVVGSFLDQVKSEKEACEKLLRCTKSVQSELCLDIQGPCLLDCRHPESRGINQICRFLQEALPINTSTLSYNLHWVLVQVRKAFSTPALRLHEFQTWLQDNAVNLPRNLPTPEEVCQDLSAAGHTLFLSNKQDPSQSWLVLDLPTLLHDVYGTLFSGSQGKVNRFGLLHCSQLAELFPKLDQTLIQDILISLEFCIEVDPLLLKEELSQLTIDEGGEGWLYFPALVLAQPCKVFPEDPDPDKFQWMCWQLRTAGKHFISAHLLQTIIFHLAANHVFTHKLSPSVRKYCCSVWVNGLSWRSTKGVDVAVQISDSSVVQVIGRSQAGSERLHRYMSTIVRDIIATTAQLSPQLKATSYIVHPYTPTLWANLQAPQPDSLYPVSSITHCISKGDDYVLSLPKEDDDHPQQMSLSKLFGWSPLPSAVQDMNFNEVSSSADEWIQQI